MSKYAAGLVCFFLVIAGLSEVVAPKFSNGGFEKKMWKGRPSHWGGRSILKNKKIKVPRLSLDKSDVKEGVNSLKVEMTEAEKVIILESSLGSVVPGKVYEVSFWCKISGPLRVWLRENHISPTGKWNAKLFKNFINLQGPTVWKKYSAKIKTYPGDGKLGITVFINKGPGTVWFDDFKIQEYKAEAGGEVAFRMTPNYYTQNNVFHLPQNSPLMLYLTCANKTQHKFQNPRVVIDLPGEIKLLSCGYDSKEYKPARKIKKNGRNYLRYEYTMGVPKIIMRSPDFSNPAWNSIVPMLQTNARPSTKSYACYIAYKDDKLSCRPVKFDVKITPPISKPATPKNFSIGIHANTSLEFYGDALKRFMKFYKNSGFNTLYLPEVLRAGSISPGGIKRDASPIYAEADKQGIATYMSSNSLCNGYMLRYVHATKRAPDSVKLKRANGAIDKQSFDPAYIIRKGEWYAKGINQIVDRAVKFKAKGIWVNWEPYMYIGHKGSFTELSLKDFARFAGMNEAKILKMPFKNIVSKYREQLYKFQSFQYAMAMKSMMELIKKRSEELNYPLDVDLCTGSVFYLPFDAKHKYFKYRKTFMTELWLENFDTVSSWLYLYFKSDDYKDKNLKKLIDLGCRVPEGDALTPKSHAKTLTLVEDMVAYIKKQSLKNKRKPPRYIHLTQNIQCRNWTVTPQEFAIQIMASFLGGADGVGLYFFPLGYDGEYWRLAALANAKIAKFEDLVMNGQKVNDVKVEPLTELFNSKEADFKQRLQVRTFSKGGKLLVAICNFDYLARAPVKLKIKVPDGKYALSAPWTKQTYVLNGKDLLSHDDLSNVSLLVKPMTVRFLLLSPWGKQVKYSKKINLNDIQRQIKSLIPVLNKEFIEREKAIKRTLKTIQEGEKQELKSAVGFKPLNSNGFKTSLVKERGAWVYQVKSAKNELNIAPEAGATVTSWNVGDKQIAGKICYDRFYMPKGYSNGLDKQIYELKSQKIKNKALEVCFVKKITKGNLKGLVLQKKFVINSSAKTIQLKYNLTNNSESPVTIGFWVWNLFEQSEWKFKPELTIGKVKSDTKQLEQVTYYEKLKVPAIFNILRKFKHLPIKSSTVLLNSTRGSVTIKTDSAKLAGFLAWSLGKESRTTLETMLVPEVLAKGASTSIKLKYQYFRH
jgi:carbohydrate binding protein with CBM4/9 domain